jgi:predicted branched-subunit amino acid permease
MGNMNGLGLVAAFLVGYIARKNDVSWNETFIYCAFIYALFILF